MPRSTKAPDSSPVYHLDCLRFLSSIGNLHPILYPHRTAIDIHKAILTKINRQETLADIEDGYNNLNLAIEFTSQRFVDFVGNLTRVFTDKDGFTTETVQRSREILHEQLEEVVVRLENLLELYGTVKSAYDSLNTATTEAFRKAQLSTWQRFLVSVKPRTWDEVPVFHMVQKYLIPHEVKLADKDKALQGTLAWERETQRLEQILYSFQEMRNSLATESQQGTNKISSYLKIDGAKWNTLTKSADNDEKTYAFILDDQLCKQGETWWCSFQSLLPRTVRTTRNRAILNAQ
ncbi:MAG: hypothetical protein LQ337_007072 [Flavoplaca oasis]|nr:MAG: hypothetical protein LQ337_007072 [Flavoplaca oasis]